jgi:MFS family permease
MPIALIGAVIGGLGAGLLWTCQGAFLTMLCEKLADQEGRVKEEVTAEIMGTWGLIFLGCECSVRALTTVFTKYAELSKPTVFYIWAGVALLSTLTFLAFASNFSRSQPFSRSQFTEKLLAAVSLWSEPQLWLLQCTNITFGFAAAWNAGYVSQNITTKALGADFIGFAAAMLSGIAAILSKLFGFLSQRYGKGPIVLLGALAFLSLGIFSKWVGEPAKWGWGTLVFYAFMGIGRAVYESTNKAIFSDFFPGPKSPGAFANVFVFNSLSSTVAFILGACNVTLPELYLLIGFAALTFPGFVVASLLQKRANGTRVVEENALEEAK